MQEEFKIINGYENYSVSNLGNVRNDKKGKVLKQSNKDGYKIVALDCKLHRVHILVAKAFIPNLYNKKCVDHIDTDKTNNNVGNLRWSTHSENNYNAPIRNDNKSGTKGVCYCKKNNKWRVHIDHNRKRYYLGDFTDKEEAIKVRKLKANELFGEFTNACEKIFNFNIKIPKNTKLNINIVIEDDLEELKLLEEEFLEKLK
jgi:hypothetical protein